MTRLNVLTVALICLVLPVLAEEKLPELNDKVVYVAAFKNGLGFFVREGEAKLQSGWGVTRSVPDATLGSFWIASTKDGARIEQLIALKEETSKPVAATNIKDLLQANIGKSVTLGVQDKTFTGTILDVPQEKVQENTTEPRRYQPYPPANIVMLQTDTGTTAVNVSQINWVQINGTANTSASIPSTDRRMKFKVSGNPSSCPVSTAYLQKGLTWSPSYLIEILGEDKARLTMQGLLVNDAEDLDKINVSFVVGYPNFVCSDILSPLACKQSVAEFIQSLNSGGSSGNRSSSGFANVMAQSAIYNNDVDFYSQPEFTYSTVSNTPGVEEEDLFLYRKTGVTLKKGERAYYDVFSAEVPFEHIYEWDSSDESGIDSYGSVQSSSHENDNTPKNQVWHKLKLKNISDYPWTTAPAFVLNNHQPLAQDILNYTSKGGSSNMKLTVATDVKAKAEEWEISREQVKLEPYTFWKITTKGKLFLSNFKNKAVTVDIKKHITGEMTEATDSGKSTKSVKGPKAVNPSSVITWQVPLKPGEEKTVEYTYTSLIRY